MEGQIGSVACAGQIRQTERAKDIFHFSLISLVHPALLSRSLSLFASLADLSELSERKSKNKTRTINSSQAQRKRHDKQETGRGRERERESTSREMENFPFAR